ncbi:unnamed protein product [Rhizophagus irregularis]|nr:unnamed protein product [Rhizophagus irregularis]
MGKAARYSAFVMNQFYQHYLFDLSLITFKRYFRQSKAFVPVHLETEKMAMDKYYHQENAVLRKIIECY